MLSRDERERLSSGAIFNRRGIGRDRWDKRASSCSSDKLLWSTSTANK